MIAVIEGIELIRMFELLNVSIVGKLVVIMEGFFVEFSLCLKEGFDEDNAEGKKEGEGVGNIVNISDILAVGDEEDNFDGAIDAIVGGLDVEDIDGADVRRSDNIDGEEVVDNIVG